MSVLEDFWDIYLYTFFEIAKLQNIIFYFQELLDFFLVIRFSY